MEISRGIQWCYRRTSENDIWRENRINDYVLRQNALNPVNPVFFALFKTHLFLLFRLNT